MFFCNFHVHIPIEKHTPLHTIYLQTPLHCNCSDIYICTWSLSASFHYLEPDLERGGLEWMPNDWNERGTKCTWKSYFELKPRSTLSDTVTHRVSMLLRTAAHTTIALLSRQTHTDVCNMNPACTWVFTALIQTDPSCITNHQFTLKYLPTDKSHLSPWPIIRHNITLSIFFLIWRPKLGIHRRQVISLRTSSVCNDKSIWTGNPGSVARVIHHFHSFVIKYLFSLFAGGQNSVTFMVTSA